MSVNVEQTLCNPSPGRVLPQSKYVATRLLHRWRLTTALLLAMVLVVPGASSVLAAPMNDDFSNALVLTGLPFTSALSTADATQSPDDPDCVGAGPTVWYRFTPSESIRVGANTSGSDYDTTLSVYTGSRGGLSQIACNDDANGTLQSRVAFDAQVGTTYYFMVGAFASGPGSNLTLSIAQLPPLPPPVSIDVTVNRMGSVNTRTGTVTLQGTVTCSRQVFVDLAATVREKASRATINGTGFTGTACLGRTPWSATFSSDSPNFTFVPGRASVTVSAFAFDSEGEEPVSDQAANAVTLSASH
jgi:hypothetical protein